MVKVRNPLQHRRTPSNTTSGPPTKPPGSQSPMEDGLAKPCKHQSRSEQRASAVNRERLTTDPTGSLGDEEGNPISNVSCLAKSPQRDTLY